MKESLKKLYFKVTGKIKQKKLNHKDFTIISNNCFGGIVYRNNALPYNTPTAGLFFMADDYIKFVYNMKEYLDKELKEIKIDKSKHKKYLNSINYNAPIGKLGDIEIMFLHYPTFEEAKEKWDRRKKRINYDKIIYKFSEQNECTYEHLKKFDEFKADNKICFTYNKYDDLNAIQFKEFEGDGKSFSDSSEKIFKKYLDIYEYLNNITIFSKKKIVHIMSGVHFGGVETFLYNYFSYINMNDYDMTFVVHDGINEENKKMFEKFNIKFYKVVPKKQGLFTNLKQIYDIIKKERPDIVHCHMSMANFFPLIVAKFAKVKLRISHSHVCKPNKSILDKIYSYGICKCANMYIACSKKSGEFIYGNKDFKVIKNAFDTKTFYFDEKIRKKIRKNLGIDDKIVIGHVGRFSEEKNHEFLLKVFQQLLKENPKFYLLLIGTGDLLEEIKSLSKEMRIYDNILFLGVQSNVNDYYNAMDLFLFPSKFEGLGISLIEAQISGLPCVASSTIPKEAKISNNVTFIDLNCPLKKWCASIKKSITAKRTTNIDSIKTYDILNEYKVLEEIYKIN